MKDKGEVLFEAFVASIGADAKTPEIAKAIAENRKARAKLKAAERAFAKTQN